jgi:hypothetical protein
MCFVEWVEELNERAYSSIWNGMQRPMQNELLDTLWQIFHLTPQ